MATVQIKPQYKFKDVIEQFQFVENMDFLLIKSALVGNEVTLDVSSMATGDSLYVMNTQTNPSSNITLGIQGGLFVNTQSETLPSLNLQQSEQVLLICQDATNKKFTFIS